MRRLKKAALHVLLVGLFIGLVVSCAASIALSNIDQIVIEFVDQLGTAEQE